MSDRIGIEDQYPDRPLYDEKIPNETANCTWLMPANLGNKFTRIFVTQYLGAYLRVGHHQEKFPKSQRATNQPHAGKKRPLPETSKDSNGKQYKVEHSV